MTTDVCGISEFFNAALNFLKDNQWIYNYPNTHILCNKVLDEIPQEWRHHLNNITNSELNSIPFGNVNDDWPESLKTFICKISQINNCDAKLYDLFGEFPKMQTGAHLTPKKAHEIACLAAVVNNVCSKMNLNCIIDVGAGLGYLSQLLYRKYNYKVLAIEGNEKIYTSAIQNQEKNSPSTKPHVKYIKHYVTLESSQFIEKALEEHFKDVYKEGICITGLHACADLSVTILEIFRQLHFVKCIIIMPCCYHRLEALSNNEHTCEERFENFPVSMALETVYNNLEGWKFLRGYFLRLSCQQTKSSWRTMSNSQHEAHATSCMFRAIIQEVAEEGNFIVKRLKRKTRNLRTCSTPEEMIQNLIANFQHTHELIPKYNDSINAPIDYVKFESSVLEKWNENKEKCKQIEVLTAFQTAIQSLCENIVLLDRVCFLREEGLECDVFKVTDDNISPRCHALVATKP